MGLQTTDSELLAMNRVARLLGKLPEDVRGRIAHWVAVKDWSDAPAKADHGAELAGTGPARGAK
jgi:hypothetical protein